jgi:hypothetical protein
MFRGQAVRLVLPLTMAVLISACVTTGQAPPAEEVRAPTPVQAALAPAGPLPPGPKPAAPAGFLPDARTVPTTPPPLPPTRPPFPRVAPTALDGLKLERALTLFGRPAAVARGPDVTTWTYRTAGCRLEIDFHFSIQQNAMRAHASRIAGPATPEMCLHALAIPRAALAER